MKFKDYIINAIKNVKQGIKLAKDKIISTIKDNIIEIYLTIGVLLIIKATYILSYIAFLYLSGFIFIALAVFLLKFPKK